MKKKTVFLHFILIYGFASSVMAQTVEPASAPASEQSATAPVTLFEPMPENIPLHRTPPVRERTQYFWQPLKGLSAVTLSVENSTNDYTTVASTGVITTTASQTPTYTLIYWYGITRDWAVNFSVATSPNQTQSNVEGGAETDTSTGGPNDVSLTFKNTTPLWRWNLHYGIKMSYSLDVDQPASASTQGNDYTGGDSVEGYLGTSYNVFKKSFLGVRAEYDYIAARTVDPNRSLTTARQKTGGNEIIASGFFEWHIYPFLIDFSNTYYWISAGHTMNNATQTDYGSYTTIYEDLGFQFFFSKSVMARVDAVLIEASEIVSTTNVQNAHTQTEGTLTVRAEF